MLLMIFVYNYLTLSMLTVFLHSFLILVDKYMRGTLRSLPRFGLQIYVGFVPIYTACHIKEKLKFDKKRTRYSFYCYGEFTFLPTILKKNFEKWIFVIFSLLMDKIKVHFDF